MRATHVEAPAHDWADEDEPPADDALEPDDELAARGTAGRG